VPPVIDEVDRSDFDDNSNGGSDRGRQGSAAMLTVVPVVMASGGDKEENGIAHSQASTSTKIQVIAASHTRNVTRRGLARAITARWYSPTR